VIVDGVNVRPAMWTVAPLGGGVGGCPLVAPGAGVTGAAETTIDPQ